MNMPTPISLPSTGTVVSTASDTAWMALNFLPVNRPTTLPMKKISGIPRDGNTLGRARLPTMRTMTTRMGM